MEDVDAPATSLVRVDRRPAGAPPALRDELRLYVHLLPRFPGGDCRAPLDAHARRLLPRQGAPLLGRPFRTGRGPLLVSPRMELARGRHAPERNRSVLDHRV